MLLPWIDYLLQASLQHYTIASTVEITVTVEARVYCLSLVPHAKLIAAYNIRKQLVNTRVQRCENAQDFEKGKSKDLLLSSEKKS